MINERNTQKPVIRAGLKDIWNAYMLKGASYSNNDIPFCPTTSSTLPKAIITYNEAITVFNKLIVSDEDFFYDSYVCFYMDDDKFDGPRGIWNQPQKAFDILHHFAGVITPDFSTYQDFPEPLKIYNTYRMRTFGYWLGRNNLAVINNVRWGTPETYKYCFDGIPKNSIVSIGTVGGSPKKLVDRDRFNSGITRMVEVLHPHTILIYGSANYPCFAQLKEQGICIIPYPGKTSQAFARRKTHE